MTRALDREPSLAVWTLTVPVGFRIARARIRYSHHVLVRIRDGESEGWGSAPLYARGPHELAPGVARARTFAEPALATGPSQGRLLLADRLHATPDLLSALDGALWDLEGRQTGRSVATLLGGSPGPVPITEQVFVTDPAGAADVLMAMRARGTMKIKLKLSGAPSQDLRLLERAREALGSSVELRVDVNRGYRYDQALAVAPELRRLGVVQWEEPIDDDFDAIARLRIETGLQVMLDESVRSPADLDAALQAEAMDILNVKLGRLGGITVAERYRHTCASAGVDVSIGCAEDLGPGMAAILHASRAWQPLETEGIGWMRLGQDLGSPSPEIVDGCVHVLEKPGWGLDVSSADGLVPEHDWTRSFRLQGWLRRQHQRAANVRARLGDAGGR